MQSTMTWLVRFFTGAAVLLTIVGFVTLARSSWTGTAIMALLIAAACVLIGSMVLEWVSWTNEDLYAIITGIPGKSDRQDKGRGSQEQ